MDSFFKFEKQNGNQIVSNLRKLLNVFRIVEICVLLILVSRISFQFQFQLPVGEYVKKILSFLLSHRFVFVIGNAIVITLFAKSGRDSNPDQKNPKLSSADSTYDFNEPIQNIGRVSQSEKQKVPSESVTSGIQTHDEPIQKTEEPANHNIPVKNTSAGDISLIKVDNQFIISFSEDKKKQFQRSQSECLEVEKFVKPCRVLRRSVTDSSQEKVTCASGETDDDGMSDEEFRVMVEKFIANQQKILRDEEKCWSWSHAR